MVHNCVLETLLYLVFLAVGVNPLVTLPRCLPGWILNGQSCWMAIQDQVSMAEAQTACQQLATDSNLAVPSSKTEDDFLVQLFQETWPNPQSDLWLGCTVKLPGDTLTCFEEFPGPEGHNKFLTSSASNGDDHTCVVMATGGTQWLAAVCHRWRYTICEQPAMVFGGTLQCSAISLNHAGHTRSCCLLNHTFSVTQTKSPIQCCIACIKDPKCHSFNLSRQTCQLNNATIAQVDQGKYLKVGEDCSYFEMKWT